MSTEAKIGIAQIVLAIPVLLIGWITVLDRSELVYEVRHEAPLIFLGQSPDAQNWQRLSGNLLILLIENIGRKPSTKIRGVINIPGKILTKPDKSIFHPIYCNPKLDLKTRKVDITIDRCAQGHPIQLSILYQNTNDERPTIDIADDLGEVPRVASIQQAKGRWKGPISVVVIVLGIFNGFLVISVLTKKFSTKIASRESQSTLLVSEARTKLQERDLTHAAKFLRQAKALTPDKPQVYVLLGRLRKREAQDIDPLIRADTARTLMGEAREFCTQAIKVDPEYDAGFYNRACYRSLLRESVQEIFADLEIAIQLSPENKSLALQDEDFTTNENFNELRTLIEAL